MRTYFLALGTVVCVCVGCAADGQQIFDKGEYHAPPAAMMMRPGPMVDGPGPAVMSPLTPPGAMMQAGYQAGYPGMCPPGYPGGMMAGAAVHKSQIHFLGPEGMNIGWQIGQGFAENQLVAPAIYDFSQGGVYRLDLTNIPGYEGMEFYPTLEVYPAHPTTDAFLAHSSVPVLITDEDLEQVRTNNFVTKVIYLPEPRFQELAIAGVETLVSTRLAPGIDPVAEADRRGTIMAVLRIGNKDYELGMRHGAAITKTGPNGEVMQTSYNVDGTQGGYAEPVAIGYVGSQSGIPHTKIVGGPSYPGGPAVNPISGMTTEPWGMPITATPIGLPGPPHIPLGGPASLQSHTIRNNPRVDLGKRVEYMLIDVKHDPGISLPHPVNYIQYEEKHPVYKQGEVAYPAWYGGGAPPQQ